MKQFVSLTGCAVVILLCGFGLDSTAHASEARPNVLLISVDDLNDWLGCLNGHPRALTPNIDRLANRGVLFTNAHCVAPACRPSRAALFTGQRPATTGVWSNRSSALLVQCPDAAVIPRRFAEAGYRTAGCGKLLHDRNAGPAVFQEYFRPEQRWSPLTATSVRYTETELPTKGTNSPRHVARLPDGREVVLPLNGMPSDRKPLKPDGESFDWGPLDVSDDMMGDTQITNWAIDQLQQHSEQPFFLAVGYYRPHIPLWAPAKYFERLRDTDIQLPPHSSSDLNDLPPLAREWAIEPVTAGRHSTVMKFGQWEEAVKAYLACVTFIDDQVRRLLEALDRISNNNTVIVLCSDHGWHLGEKQHWGKWTGWERSTRVPLIVVPPKGSGLAKTAGQRCHEPVSLLDVYPTLCELCGMTASEDLEGESLRPMLITPGRPLNRVAVTHFDRGNVTLRSVRWRYVRYADGAEELYDHRADPHEWHNLADAKQHQSELIRWRDRAHRYLVP